MKVSALAVAALVEVFDERVCQTDAVANHPNNAALPVYCWQRAGWRRTHTHRPSSRQPTPSVCCANTPRLSPQVKVHWLLWDAGGVSPDNRWPGMGTAASYVGHVNVMLRQVADPPGRGRRMCTYMHLLMLRTVTASRSIIEDIYSYCTTHI